MEDDQKCCKKFCRSFAKEFQVKKFSLAHEPSDDFFKSQWQRGSKSVIWLIYRWCMAVCFSFGVIGCMLSDFKAGTWFIYLTHWGFMLCMYVNIFGMLLVTIYFFNSNGIVKWKRMLKFYWLSHFCTLVLATVITVLYWTFIYPIDTNSFSDLYNLWSHGFNSILMVLDHMLVAFPTRLLHFVYPVIIGIIYAVFTVIYYFAGGLNPSGNQDIYPILDWNEPQYAVVTVVGTIIFLLVIGTLIFCLYKLRLLIHSKLNSKSFKINA